MDRKLHDIAWELRPSLRSEEGLRSALENSISDWSVRYKLPVDLNCVGLDNDDLPALVEATILRVVQEALTNIVKHAAAAKVRLLVERGNDQLRVVIEDDGKGLDPDAVTAPGQLGLIGIRERVALINGTLSVEAASPSGTILTITAPLTSAVSGSS